MRTFGLILTATIVLAVGSASAIAPSFAADAPGAAATARTSGGNSANASATSTAKTRALKKCHRINRKAKRKACVKRINRKFAKPVGPPAATGTVYDIDVRDKYFSPNLISIKSGDALDWIWNDVNKDAHNVDLVSAPAGVKTLDFSTPSSPSRGFHFQRTFTTPGTYQFVCSIHVLMTMEVDVTK